MSIQCLQKVADKTADVPGIRFETDNEKALAGDRHVVSGGGGNRVAVVAPDAFEAVDTLFVDEAAQMSLANVLAVSQACRALVLLGDPQQLEQPIQGSHPEGTDVSALEHVLGRAGDHRRRAGLVPGRDLAPASRHLLVHVRAVLRRQIDAVASASAVRK